MKKTGLRLGRHTWNELIEDLPRGTWKWTGTYNKKIMRTEKQMCKWVRDQMIDRSTQRQLLVRLRLAGYRMTGRSVTGLQK